MGRLTTKVVLLAVALGGAWSSAAALLPETAGGRLETESINDSLLTPPREEGPVVVHTAFEIHDINDISDVAETFEFTGVLTLTWKDPRQAFKPSAGEFEKVFQGYYQFNELSTRWYPLVILTNESGLYQKSGVVLRVQPDGTSTLIEKINAVAEVEMDMRWFPFDDHRLEAVFQVLGFNRDEVLLQAESTSEGSLSDRTFGVPQWTITKSGTSTRDRQAFYDGRRSVSSAFVVSLDVERDSFYIRRMVSFPLAIIVLLSFSVFWMDRSSLGDRINVSFIGILMAVAYQLVMGDILPKISYFTLIHAFLILSFMTMAATVVINLVVGAMDKKGSYELGDRVDRRCRWIFPLAYFGLIAVIFGAARLFF